MKWSRELGSVATRDSAGRTTQTREATKQQHYSPPDLPQLRFQHVVFTSKLSHSGGKIRETVSHPLLSWVNC